MKKCYSELFFTTYTYNASVQKNLKNIDKTRLYFFRIISTKIYGQGVLSACKCIELSVNNMQKCVTSDFVDRSAYVKCELTRCFDYVTSANVRMNIHIYYCCLRKYPAVYRRKHTAAEFIFREHRTTRDRIGIIYP